ncbi:MAG: heme ABC transporter ATP-binding protein [Rhizobiales bacterium 65-9]|nr:ABC transporter ATP-binding protein [Hyphomicrobiales bacterium]OJY37424.1 MAG: heme ABC transporter ATP-binding protein [Rhizobiales bacterium 65-9]
MNAIELSGIDKRFGAVHANRAVSMAVAKGSIHGIVGENGAGKSTLMSILYGFYEADAGDIRVNGDKVRFRSSRDAIAAGIGMVFQHFMLVETFTVLENILLGAEGGALLGQGRARMRADILRLARDYALEVEPDAVVKDLSVGLQQRVEILKALARGSDILILDEPTGVLTPQEADHLFRILRQLRENGKTVMLITHKLREIMAITDSVSVMRRGEMVATLKTADTSPDELAALMVGRSVKLRVEKKPAAPGAEALRVSRLTVTDERGLNRVDDVSFTLRGGEIVGVAGVAGNGQSELMEAIAGMRPIASGEILFNGAAVTRDPQTLRKRGMGHVPEDRHRTGLVVAFEACENGILGYQDAPPCNRGLLLDRDAIVDLAAKRMQAYDVRPPDPFLRAAAFSGGNQQKIVLAREIEQDPALLLVGQPTRGVDIGAIEFIHRRILAMRDAGKAVLLVSVELDEILSLSDRILVMCGGKIIGERNANETNERDLGLLMAGVDHQATAA